ncbi:hypothetical protein NC653_024688 [Populus alba x Populus x berolinensis]|uniref:Uncharacterized protein n=1 Tax=Populus alba x Populus x berolinensis TaxID=444605 RepID=A0AAD6MA81_9ROSI|nr:hypothetical protein NC653_024688 [Populus alba x Populus x berolinensis]
MHAEVAEKHASCDNQIILAGDAAPRSPPAGGFEYLSKKSSNSFSWWSMCQMTYIEGAVLVRPDEHIAWRVKSSLDEDPMSEMRMELAMPRQLSWTSELQNFACFGVEELKDES